MNGHYHNPDFKVTGQNKVIEIWGSHWHKNDDGYYLINLYRRAGLDCLIIKESEFYPLTNSPSKRILNKNRRLKIQRKVRAFVNDSPSQLLLSPPLKIR